MGLVHPSCLEPRHTMLLHLRHPRFLRSRQYSRRHIHTHPRPPHDREKTHMRLSGQTRISRLASDGVDISRIEHARESRQCAFGSAHTRFRGCANWSTGVVLEYEAEDCVGCYGAHNGRE